MRRQVLDLVGKRNAFYLFSLVILLPGVISLMIPPSLTTGIDFSGGTEFTVRFEQPVTKDELNDAFAELGHSEARVQGTGGNEFLVRTKELEGAESAPEVGPRPPGEEAELRDGLVELLGPLVDLNGDVINRFLQSSSVSASISGSLDIKETLTTTLWSAPPAVCCGITGNAITALIAVSIAIFLFLWWTFRSVPQPFRFGTAAVIALVHDAVLVLGVFSILGKLFGTEIDKSFIVALLTVIGFSVNDSIVVFDRIRETVLRGEERTFSAAVNSSLLQTLARSLNTSFTLVFAILALLLMGGDSIREFLFAMLIGTIAGTYSSIFIAAQVLVTWDEDDVPRLFRRLLGRDEEGEPASAEA